MKKDLLFIMNNLNCGGAEKSLISLLNTIDPNLYNIDLFLFKHEGIFMDKLPKNINLLPEPENYKYFDMPFVKALFELLKKREFKAAFSRMILGLLAKTENNGAVIEQKLWRYLSQSIPDLEKEFDVAIGFMEKNPIYFCLDKVKAKKKVGWIHTDYSKLGIDLLKEKKFFERLDSIVTVSEGLVNILKVLFPEIEKNIISIKNIVSKKMIHNMSNESVNLNEVNGFSLITVGRLAKEKGLDIALEAVTILVKKGYNIKWYLVGEGNVRGELEKAVYDKGINNKVVFLGLRENPYPYIREADIYLQTSRFEGKSIAIEEAKILAKPIIITNFDTACQHIENEENGIIAEMNSESVSHHLERLINDERLRNKFIVRLSKENLGTENEILKFYRLVDNI